MPISDGIAALMAYAMIGIYIRKFKKEKPF
jgi:hypothetical protein